MSEFPTDGIGADAVAGVERIKQLLQTIRTDLPNFPDDVLVHWLLPFASSTGWPPQVNACGELQGRWRYLLVRKSLAFWRSVHWAKENTDLAHTRFSPGSVETIGMLIRGHVSGEQNYMVAELGGADSQKRFYFHMRHIAENGAAIIPPILLAKDEGYDILDGNHRIAAYVAWATLRMNRDYVLQFKIVPAPLMQQVPVWIGRVR